jgi:hypothetical protein
VFCNLQAPTYARKYNEGYEQHRMNPDLDDPYNHVPPVTPGDDWEDLDEGSEKAKMGLPARRADRGLPPRKERRAPQVNEHTPKLKLEQDEAYSPIAPRKMSEDLKDLAPPAKPEGTKVAPGKAAKKSARKTARKTAKKAAKRVSKKTAYKEVAGTEVKDAPAPEEERIVLPPVTGSKRLHVKEIDPANDIGKRRPQKIAPKAAKEDLEDKLKSVGRLQRRFVRGERGDWGNKTGKGSFIWIAVTGVGVIALVVIAVILSQRSGGDSTAGKDSIYSQLSPTAEENFSSAVDTDMLVMLTNSQDEAKRIFARFATAKTPDEFVDVLYGAEKISEMIQTHWEPLGMKDGWSPADSSVWTVLERDGLRYGVLEGVFSDFTRFSAYFRRDAEGLKMDWKATSGFGSAEISELKQGTGDGSEIRVWISRADFYTFPLPEEIFRSFKLMSPDGQENLWGYARVGSDLDGKLLSLFAPGQITGETQRDAAVVLALEPGPEESIPNQWIITKLLRLNWLDE